MSEKLQKLIDTHLSELFSRYEFKSLHASNTDLGGRQDFQHEHLILQVLLEGEQTQLLIGSAFSRREFWPLTIIQDALDPQEELRNLPPLQVQVNELLDIWDQLLSLLAADSFASTREKVLEQIRRRSETLFNFSNLGKL